MSIEECYQKIGGDYNQVLARLMTPKLVCHFVMILALAERATVLFDIRPFSVRTQLKKRWDSGRRKRKISEKQKSGG